MDTLFASIFNKLEQQRLALLDQVKSLPTDVPLKSTDGKWSIVQILAHLLISERLSVGYMKKKSLGIEKLKDSGLKQVIVSRMLKISQRIPVRYKAPNVIVENTPDALSLGEIMEQWNESRNDLRQFLENIQAQHSRKLIFKHPIAGMLNAEQAMKFMYEHINHHLPQIKRLLNQ